MSSARNNPGTSVAVAAGVAAAGAFLWSRRDQIGDAVASGMDRLSELKTERMSSGQTQEAIAEKAMTLKETGRKSKGPRGQLSQQDIKAGMATVQ
jgi:hypothetical protein